MSSRSAWLWSLLGALTLVPGTGFSEGLSIALANDDGWDARNPGAQTGTPATGPRGEAGWPVDPAKRQRYCGEPEQDRRPEAG